MIGNNIRLSWHAIRSSRWRSLLTTFGIIIGVASVITTVSLGEGVKNQVRKQVNYLGDDIITVRPGQPVNRDKNGGITAINFISSLEGAVLTDNDLLVIQNTPGVSKVVPLSVISGVPTKEDRTFNGGITIATNSGLPEIIKHKVEFGEFFRPEDQGKNVAVVGSKVAHELFRENVPIGKSFSFRGQDFLIRGVLEDFDSNPIVPGVDFNAAIFIPDVTAKTLTNNSAQMFQIFVKPTEGSGANAAISAVHSNLKDAHGGQEDFSVLTQAEALGSSNSVLDLLTSLVAAVAVICLFVGGIGVMNIMLVSVTERTHEIGIRKAIGATNRQILNEFLIEAVVLSLVGGLIGTALAVVINVLIHIFTNIQPVITWQVLLIANGFSLLVGIVFGVAPAMKAARKDPIEALRNE